MRRARMGEAVLTRVRHSLRFFPELYRRVLRHDVLPNAAELAYYFIFSVFPFLFFLAALSAFLPIQGAVRDFFRRLSVIMPGQAMDVLRQHMESLVQEQQPHLLTVGLLLALWGASRGVNAFRRALNIAYEVEDRRAIWTQQILCIVLTVVGGVFVFVGFAAMAIGGDLGLMLAQRLRIEQAYVVTWSWLRWPFTALWMMAIVTLAYWWLPDVRQRFLFISPGALVGTGLWILATWGFTVYVEQFGRFNVTYGSIGAVIVLLLWLYVTGAAFLLGGEVNALIEHSSKGGKHAGEHEPGEQETMYGDGEQRITVRTLPVVDARRVRERLAACGFLENPERSDATAVFQALRRFQRERHLEETGLLDPVTLTQLGVRARAVGGSFSPAPVKENRAK